MASNHYFNHYTPDHTPEHDLYADLTAEFIHMYGHDCYYLPRESLTNLDLIFGEDPTSAFTRFFQFEMYIRDIEQFGGQHDFFGKFGIEIRDRSNVLIAKEDF